MTPVTKNEQMSRFRKKTYQNGGFLS